MRLLAVLAGTLALAAPAAAAPRFAVYDLQRDLAAASRNGFGDVAPRARAALAGRGTLVRCATWCRFGSGWLAFRAGTRLGPADVSGASVRASRALGWTVRLRLTPAARGRWSAFARSLRAAGRRRGVPDVLVVAVAGRVAAAPLATQVRAAKGTLTLTGFTKAGAKALLGAIS